MKIEVIGSGCKKCKELYEHTQEAVRTIGFDATVTYTTDVGKIVAMGLMSSPVLTINDKPVLVGMLPDVEKIIELIKTNV